MVFYLIKKYVQVISATRQIKEVNFSNYETFQTIDLQETDIIQIYEYEENIRPRTTPDGYEIYYDFSEEVKMKELIAKLNKFLEKDLTKNTNIHRPITSNRYKK